MMVGGIDVCLLCNFSVLFFILCSSALNQRFNGTILTLCADHEMTSFHLRAASGAQCQHKKKDQREGNQLFDIEVL